MEITNLTFIVSDDCNYNCFYCPQKKEKKTINNTIIETAVDFFYPFLKNGRKNRIGFYGGEPLLAFEHIKHAALLVEGKNKTGNKHIEFSVTTNGSLLTKEMLAFFQTHKFGLMLSFDGLAQEMRKKDSLDKMVRVMKSVQEYPNIDFEINSVFSPRTIGRFSESLRFIIEQGGPEITFNLSTIEEWNPADISTLKEELERLVDFLVLYYKEKGVIPVKNFQARIPGRDSGPGIFRCNAGKDHISVSPDGKLWGCYLFHDFFKAVEGSPNNRCGDYCYGTLTDFIGGYKKSYPEITANYSQLCQDFFQVEGRETQFCFLCEEVEKCSVCPVYAAYSTGSLGKISCSQCKLIKMQRNALKRFNVSGGLLFY